MKQINILGRLGEDAKILDKKESEKFFTVAMNVAVSESYLNSNGDKIETVDWFSCFKTFNKKPEKMLDYLKKGNQIYLSGKPNFSINETEKGNYKKITIAVREWEIIFKPKNS